MSDSNLTHALKIQKYDGEKPRYIGDDLLAEGRIDELLNYIYRGEKNYMSDWFEDKPLQVLMRLCYIAKRYQYGITPLKDQECQLLTDDMS